MAEKYVDWKLMEDFMVDAFVGYGVPREDAKICVDVLIEADRRGIDSHAQVAESMDFGCLDDDEEERADGTTDNGER